MFDPDLLIPKSDPSLQAESSREMRSERRQRRMMVGALALLLVALAVLIYRDRDFWFPESQEATDQPEQTVPGAAAPARAVTAAAAATPLPAAKSKRHGVKPPPAEKPAVPESTPPVTTAAQRTILPPLEVEVVAGDVHRTVQPGTNSVRVDMRPGSPPLPASEPTSSGVTAAAVTHNAGEKAQISSGTGIIVRQVKPDYPLLARQMKVQGSVILQAMISREGNIQGLQVVSGPPILANAAQEAVKQWRFKPHYEGSEAVETQAKITVNFTISTN